MNDIYGEGASCPSGPCNKVVISYFIRRCESLPYSYVVMNCYLHFVFVFGRKSVIDYRIALSYMYHVHINLIVCTLIAYQCDPMPATALVDIHE